MAERIDNLEVGIGLNDRDLVEGLAKSEAKVDKFATKVRKTRPVATVDLNLQKFKIGVREVNSAVKDLGRKKATVAIRADTRGFLRAYGEVKLALAAVRSSFDKNTPVFKNATNFVARFFNKLGQKGPFESFARGFLSMRVQLGLFSTTIRQAMGVLTVFGPIIEGVIGSLVALAGALGEGLVAAAAVGGSALTGMVLTLGGVKAAITPTVTGFQNAMKASDAYAQQVRKTGIDSDKAKKKLEELNSTMAHIPADSRDAVRAWGKVREEFRALTRETAQKNVGGVVNQGVATAKALMPAFAQQTNRATDTIGGGIQSGLKALRGNEIKGQIDTIMSGFNTALPLLLQGFGQLGALLLRIFSAASPFVVDLARSFADWATHLNQANGDAGVLGQTLGRMWGYFKNIFGLLSSAGSLLKTVLAGGASAGDDLVGSLKRTLDHWNAILQTPKGQADMADFFKRAKDTAKELGPALLTLVGNAARFSEATKPIADAILGVIAIVGKFFGLLQSIPVVGPILSLAAGFAIVAQKMGLLIPLVKLVRGLFSVEMFAGVLAAIGPAGWIVLGLIAVGAGLVILWKKSETFRKIMTAVWDAVKSGFVSFIDTLLGGISGMLTAFSNIAKHIPGMKGIGKAAEGAANDIDKLRESLHKVPPKTNVKVKVTIDEVDFAGQATGDAAKNKAFGATGDGIGRAVKAAATNATQRRARTDKGFAAKIADSVGGMGAADLPRGSANLQGADPRLGGFGRIARGFGLGVSPGGGRRPPGTRTSTGGLSWHNTGEAVDFGNGAGPDRAKMAFFNVMRSRFGGRLAELIYSPAGGRQIKNGANFLYGEPVRGDHFDHVHVAMDLGAKGQGIGGGGGGGGRNTNRIGQNFRGDGLGIGDGPGRSNAEMVWRYLVGEMGLTPAQAAGVMGNLNQESGFNPTAIEGGGKGPGIGIAQWSHGRASALKAYAAKRHMPWNNLGVQLDFMAQEFRGSESAAFRALKGQHTIAGASEAFGRKYERYGVKGDRGGAAFFNRFKGIRGGSGGGGTSGPTKAEIKAQERKLQRRLDALDDRLRALRLKKQSLPAGKKGTAARAKINAEINKLMGQRTTLARRKRDLPTGRDPSQIPTLGPTDSAPLDSAISVAEAAETSAGLTSTLTDDLYTNAGLATAVKNRTEADTERLTKVEGALKGKLREATRDRLLQEKDTIRQRLLTDQAKLSELTKNRRELIVQRKFAGGRGSAGLDFLAASAASTETLRDDVAVMNQQLALWKALLVERTKRGDLAGMTEAQQNINTLTGSIADANKSMADAIQAKREEAEAADQSIWDKQIEYYDLMAEQAGHTASLSDDITAAQNQYNIASAYANRQGEKYGWNSNEAIAAMNSVFAAAENVREAQVKAEEAPLLAQQATAALSDTTDDDIAATKALLDFHVKRLNYYQSITDYAGITEEAGAVKSLRDQLNQQQGDVFTQTRLFSEARADLLRTLGSNFDPITPSGTQMGGRSVTVNNYYKTMPLDAHTWSRDVLFELQAAG